MTNRHDATCCCCCQLQCGTTVVAVLFLISHGLGVILSIVSVVASAEMGPSEPSREVYIGSSAGTLAFLGIWFVLDILLLRGIATEQRGLVLAWLCWSIFWVVASLLGGIAFVIVAALIGELWLISTSCSTLLPLLIDVYWAYVVWTFYKTMGKPNAGGLVVGPGQVATVPGLAYGQPMAPSQQYGMGIQYQPGMTPGGGYLQQGMGMQHQPTNALGGGGYPQQGMGMQYQPGVAAVGGGYDNRGMDTSQHGMDAPYRTSETSPGGGYPDRAADSKHQPSMLPRVGGQDRRSRSPGASSDRGHFSTDRY